MITTWKRRIKLNKVFELQIKKSFESPCNSINNWFCICKLNPTLGTYEQVVSYIYIYIYIYRKKERERNRESDRQTNVFDFHWYYPCIICNNNSTDIFFSKPVVFFLNSVKIQSVHWEQFVREIDRCVCSCVCGCVCGCVCVIKQQQTNRSSQQ